MTWTKDEIVNYRGIRHEIDYEDFVEMSQNDLEPLVSRIEKLISDIETIINLAN